MVIGKGLLIAKVFHKRYTPKENCFTYKVYYLSVFLKDLVRFTLFKLLSKNRFNLFSFYEKDYGFEGFNTFQGELEELISSQEKPFHVQDILLITLPRVLGYAFNPVSFWFCFDEQKDLRAVFCEVNNTFGERHGYLCRRATGEVIGKDDILKTKKVFHVSPFYPINGEYTFRFHLEGSFVGIWIDYYLEGRKTLSTSLVGNRFDLTDGSLFKAFFRYPFLTIKIIFLIHYQALKLVIKRLRYFRKPKPPEENITQ